jgi:hypothetical protein
VLERFAVLYLKEGRQTALALVAGRRAVVYVPPQAFFILLEILFLKRKYRLAV